MGPTRRLFMTWLRRMLYPLLYPYYIVRYRHTIKEALALGIEEQSRRLMEEVRTGRYYRPTCCEELAEEIGRLIDYRGAGVVTAEELVRQIRMQMGLRSTSAEEQTKQGTEPIK